MRTNELDKVTVVATDYVGMSMAQHDWVSIELETAKLS